MNLSEEYAFNTSKARQSVLLFILLSISLVVLLLVFDEKLILGIVNLETWYLLSAALYLSIVFVLIKRLLASFRLEPKILLNKDEFLMPTYHLGQKKIQIKDIYSIEELKLRNNLIGFHLGIRGKESYLIDMERFRNSDDFEQVYSYLCKLVKEKTTLENQYLFHSFERLKNKNRIFTTYILGIVTSAIFLLELTGGNDTFLNYSLLTLGANTKATIFSLELYRFSSSIFLHSSVFHLLLNLLMLGVFSQYLEKSLGQVRFSNLFLTSSFFAVLFSSLLSEFDASIGASGGIFGLWGAYTFFKIKFGRSLPGSVNPIPNGRFYLLLLIEIIFELFLIDNVDYINHLAGFVSGFLLLSIVPLGDKLETVDHPTIYEKALCAILVSAYAAGLSYFLLLYYGLI